MGVSSSVPSREESAAHVSTGDRGQSPGDRCAQIAGGENNVSVDVCAIMAGIRDKLRSGGENEKDKRAPFRPQAADFPAGASRRAGEILHSEDLRYLNTHYAYSANINFDSLTSHRPGILGRLIVKAKRKLLRIIWDSLLRDYLAAEREFHAHTVRLMNDLAKYIDARDAGNFWELIRKIDVDVTRALDRIERLADEQSADLRMTEKRVLEDVYRTLRELSARVGEIGSKVAQTEGEIGTLQSVTAGLEGIVARLGSPQARATVEAAAVPPPADQSYVLLENRFRGSEALIRERLRIYPELFRAARLPVLEIGAGRGELQKLLTEAQVPSFGVDLDQGMVAVAQEQSLDVRLADGLAVLRSIQDQSLGGLIAIQVVEHLTREQLAELMSLAARKLAAGARVVFETINPCSILALSSNYFRDPTHVFPAHPDTLRFGLTLAGLEVEEVRMLSPVPSEMLLKEVPAFPFMPPRWMEVAAVLNHNVRQLNELLYGCQDYCIVARARG